MATILCVIVCLVLGTGLFPGTPVFSSDTGDIANPKRVYETRIDSCIRSCSAKTEYWHSRSENLRHRAAIECLKKAFFIRYRDELIREMMENQVGTKPYQIHRFLNQRFYEVIRHQ